MEGHYTDKAQDKRVRTMYGVTDCRLDAYYTVMTTIVSSNESWTDSVRDTGVTWSRSYCCSSSHQCHPRSPVLG